jgi:hypothetical protein
MMFEDEPIRPEELMQVMDQQTGKPIWESLRGITADFFQIPQPQEWINALLASGQLGTLTADMAHAIPSDQPGDFLRYCTINNVPYKAELYAGGPRLIYSPREEAAALTLPSFSINRDSRQTVEGFLLKPYDYSLFREQVLPNGVIARAAVTFGATGKIQENRRLIKIPGDRIKFNANGYDQKRYVNISYEEYPGSEERPPTNTVVVMNSGIGEKGFSGPLAFCDVQVSGEGVSLRANLARVVNKAPHYLSRPTFAVERSARKLALIAGSYIWGRIVNEVVA